MTNLQKDLFFGFDSIFDAINNPKQQQSYPPYNVVRLDDNRFVIEIAIAGFSDDEISIELQKGKLTVSGAKHGDVLEEYYIHKGISNRAFTKSFTLAETIEVEDAKINNGLLQIGLTNIIPEEDKPRQIKIVKQNDPEMLTA